jgi:hypothetical protein
MRLVRTCLPQPLRMSPQFEKIVLRVRKFYALSRANVSYFRHELLCALSPGWRCRKADLLHAPRIASSSGDDNGPSCHIPHGTRTCRTRYRNALDISIANKLVCACSKRKDRIRMRLGTNASAGQLGNRCLGGRSKLVFQPVHPPFGRAGALMLGLRNIFTWRGRIRAGGPGGVHGLQGAPRESGTSAKCPPGKLKEEFRCVAQKN